MIPVVEEYGNDLGCYAVPIWDLVADLGVIGSALAVGFGAYSLITGKTDEGLTLIGTGIVTGIASSYQKATIQTTENYCSTARLGWNKK
jgi:hypothetical protein